MISSMFSSLVASTDVVRFLNIATKSGSAGINNIKHNAVKTGYLAVLLVKSMSLALYHLPLLYLTGLNAENNNGISDHARTTMNSPVKPFIVLAQYVIVSPSAADKNTWSLSFVCQSFLMNLIMSLKSDYHRFIIAYFYRIRNQNFSLAR